MEQIAINGSNQAITSIPAGIASKSVTGGAATYVLGSEAVADMINLTGTITGNVIVSCPALLANLDTTAGNTALKTVATWLKVFRNNAAGPFTVTINSGLTGDVGVVIATGATKWLGFDGLSTFLAE